MPVSKEERQERQQWLDYLDSLPTSQLVEQLPHIAQRVNWKDAACLLALRDRLG